MAIPELRVHGVSGTPPRNMLYTEPVSLPNPNDVSKESGQHVRVYRGTSERDFGVGRRVRAFHWGGLTSGSWVTALWVLLLPFSLANISGWTGRGRGRGAVTLVRTFGLILTGVFINMAVIASVDSYWHWSATSDSWGFVQAKSPLWAGVLFVLMAWVWWGFVSWASTRSHFSALTGQQRRKLLWAWDPESMLPPDGGPTGDERWMDPAGSDITNPAVWDAHPILHRLRRIHFGFGYLMLAFAAAAASDTGWEIPGWSIFDIPTGIVLFFLAGSLLVLLATGLKRGPVGPVLRRATSLHPAVGAALAVLAAGAVAFGGVEMSGSNWPHLRDTSAVLLFLATVTLLLIWIVAGKISASAGTFAAFFGLVLGAGVTFTLDEVLGAASTDLQGLNWLASAVLVWLLVGMCVIAWTVMSRINTGVRRELWDAVHATTGDLTNLFIWLPAVALTAATVSVWRRCADIEGEGLFTACFQTGSLPALPDIVGYVAAGLAALASSVAVYLFIKARRWAFAAGLLVMAPSAFFFFRARGITVAGVDLSFATVESAARTFAILLPSSLIVARLVGGLKGGVEARRGTGVIWDVAMFWPRWFHPLAPPAYGPHAVDRLKREITRRLLPDEDGDNQRPLVLTAHSQGAVIALISIALIGKATRVNELQFKLDRPAALDKLGLLTYGCPIGHLYNSYFPSAGFIPLSAAVAEALDVDVDGPPLQRRWSNLHRPTDPIGGPLLPSVDVFVDDPAPERKRFDPEPKESLIALIGYLFRELFRRPLPPPKPVYRLHSLYEPTPEFVEERARIEALLCQ